MSILVLGWVVALRWEGLANQAVAAAAEAGMGAGEGGAPAPGGGGGGGGDASTPASKAAAIVANLAAVNKWVAPAWLALWQELEVDHRSCHVNKQMLPPKWLLPHVHDQSIWHDHCHSPVRTSHVASQVISCLRPASLFVLSALQV
jgi:hypothetical protein